MPVRNKTSAQPGLTGTVRVDRRTKVLLPRLRPGDIAVIDHLDLDRATAQALLDARVAAVLNVSPFLSGRYPALGPALLAQGGVLMVDRLEGLQHVTDGSRVRVHDEMVYVDNKPVALGREVGADLLDQEMTQARSGLATQLETFTHNSTEFLRREEALLLHGEGLPSGGARLAGRPAVIVVEGQEHRSELRRIGAFVRERRPVLIGVDRGADVLHEAGLAPHVVVLENSGGELPSAATLRAARDVVVRVDRGDRRPLEHLERLGLRPVRVETSATSEDIALLLADDGDASVIVGVGMHATLDEFLDRQRAGLASTYLTRLKVGQRLVDATAVPVLYSGRLRPRHLFLALLVGLLALTVALATTPVGQEWLAQAWAWFESLRSQVAGWLS
ncbi:putative cytokinetic ring protein SteA [Nocardioides sp. GXQ0305]|uniref:putative cytokinetic ring protein SteA n=1 Tax=Nocardioides sp. GXQ0305 TaxID=3423912 RepID=UPI003D7D175B